MYPPYLAFIFHVKGCSVCRVEAALMVATETDPTPRHAPFDNIRTGELGGSKAPGKADEHRGRFLLAGIRRG